MPARVNAQVRADPEAAATISACLQAFICSRDDFWLNETRKAFEWFLGRNDLGQPLYDPGAGGCYDALHVDRVNMNQGAESTLAFLLALQEMRLAESVMSFRERPAEPEQSTATA